MIASEITKKITELALASGFDCVGITNPIISQNNIQKYEKWLEKKLYGNMDYLEKHLDLKKHPKKLLESALSIISVGLLYKPQKLLPQDNLHGTISSYAYGRDYHKVLKQKLKVLANEIQKLSLELKLEYRAFVDSGPVFEKKFAEKSGIGCSGKNSLIINPKLGSQIFLGELITNLPLEQTQSKPIDYCKSCSKCIDNCPTKAILPDNEINPSRCIAYLTIEHKGIIEKSLTTLMGNHVYGCDDCQSCCPWNSRHIYTKEIDFSTRYDENFTKLNNLIELTEEDFNKIFEGSPIRRIGWESFIRNVIIAIGNSKEKSFIPYLEKYTNSENEILKIHSQLAIETLESLE